MKQYAYRDDIRKLIVAGAVTKVGRSAFSKNANLVSAEIGGMVSRIGMFAFYGCEELEELVIGENVASIGRKAFKGCSGLKKIVIKSELLTADSVAYQAFAKLGTTVIVKVPVGKLEEYTEILRKAGLFADVTIIESED